MISDEASADAAPVERLLSQLAQLRLDPHRPSLRYRFGLLLVALCMVLLPAIYLAGIGVLGWWVATTLLRPPPMSDLYGWSGYLLLAATGPVCVFFLVKPWFSRRPSEEGALPLEPGEAPDLECFVGLLARAVGAPGPRSIELDCSVNAAASFRGGWRGVWRQELRLTLGLPLVAGLDMRSFAGVLAHELGHFGQRAGMRLAWFIMLVNDWFGRLVNGRDRWDRRLAEAARSERTGVRLFGLATLSVVWLTRQPLRLLMASCRGISSVALRELEFDADGYEIVFAGSDAFRRTSREINLLNVGSAKALRLIGEILPEGQLPRNLPSLARVQKEALSDKVRAAVEAEMMAESARFALFREAGASPFAPVFFSTHPSDRERINIAESYGEPGLVHSGEPARALFEAFDRTAERITAHFYGTQFDFDLGGCQLVDNARFNGTVCGREELFAACERFFDGRFTVARPLLFPATEVKQVLRGRYPRHPRAGSAVRRWLGTQAEVFEQFEAAEDEIVRSARASELFQAGFLIRRKAFGLPRGLAALSDRQREASARRDRALVRLAEFDHLARRCLLTAAADELAGAGSRAEQMRTRRVLRALGAMGALAPKLGKLRRLVLAQRALLQNLSTVAMGRSLIERLQRNSSELSELVGGLREPLVKVRYPFEHLAGKISIARYAAATFTDRQLVMRSYRTAEAMLERLFDLYFRLVGHLCTLAESRPAGGDR